jgi:hypothetical protein
MSRRVISQQGVCQIERCACGTVYLTIGPLTVALMAEALADVGHATNQALRRLATEALSEPSRARREDPGEAGAVAEDAAPGCSRGLPCN